MKSIGILGGDLRIIRLAELLVEEEKNIYVYGLEKTKFLSKNILQCEFIDEIYKNCNYIISGIPFSKNGEQVNAPYSNKTIKIKEVLEKLNNKTLIAGAIGGNIRQIATKNNVKVIDLMEDESFTVLNVIPTVEGAIQVAMENTGFTIHNSKCLVLGFGRIGKLLCSRLKNLDADVACMARKDKDLSLIYALGYKGIHIKDLANNLKDIDIIFNTVPAIILEDKELVTIKKENKNAIIIELASKPGGVDLEKAKQYDIKIIEAQGLPGKVAPLSAAKYIKQTLEKIII